MPYRTYTFPLRREAALLTESEWREIAPLLADRTKSIMSFRKETQCSLDEAIRRDPVGQAALAKYTALTGDSLEHPDHLYVIRMRDYGALCDVCRKPHRTPRATMCAACGAILPTGTRAGPLLPP